MPVTKSGVVRAAAGRFSHVQGLLDDVHEETVDMCGDEEDDADPDP